MAGQNPEDTNSSAYLSQLREIVDEDYETHLDRVHDKLTTPLIKKIGRSALTVLIAFGNPYYPYLFREPPKH